jgi:phytoene/squalene synthetase
MKPPRTDSTSLAPPASPFTIGNSAELRSRLAQAYAVLRAAARAKQHVAMACVRANTAHAAQDKVDGAVENGGCERGDGQ